MAEKDLRRILAEIAEERATAAMLSSASVLAKMAANGELAFLDQIKTDAPKIRKKK